MAVCIAKIIQKDKLTKGYKEIKLQTNKKPKDKGGTKGLQMSKDRRTGEQEAVGTSACRVRPWRRYKDLIISLIRGTPRPYGRWCNFAGLCVALRENLIVSLIRGTPRPYGQEDNEIHYYWLTRADRKIRVTTG